MSYSYILRSVLNTARSNGAVVTAEAGTYQEKKTLVVNVSEFAGLPVMDTNHIHLFANELKAMMDNKKTAEYLGHLVNCHMATQIRLDTEIKQWLMSNY